MHFMRRTWCGLPWTPWIPFSQPSDFNAFPTGSGISRIREVNGETLFYIGVTARGLRERLGSLRRNIMQDTMPYNDPHTAAPLLWAWRHAEGVEFECSAAPVALTGNQKENKQLLDSLKYYLLWQYRLETGFSTHGNHGRFHARYEKSGERKNGIQGYRRLDTEPDNPASGPSFPPLQLIGVPLASNWMGLSWSGYELLKKGAFSDVPKSPGIYKIVDRGREVLLSIGESENLRSAIPGQTAKAFGSSTVFFSYVELPENIADYQRKEIVNDLFGGLYALTR